MIIMCTVHSNNFKGTNNKHEDNWQQVCECIYNIFN